jgi:hypothetical protein
LPLVRYESWPEVREGDAEWQRLILAKLLETGASAEHVHAVSTEIGSARFRPEEVAGAASISQLPADFDAAVQRAAQILAILAADA